ncbi:ABC transporter substrate-binding protein [Fusibacter bizertensis]
MKHLGKMILVFAMVMILVTGCSSTKSGDGNAEITFMNFSSSGANEAVLKELVDNFMVENPNIKVEIQTYGYDDYFDQLATKVAGGSAPDVFELNIENFRSYAEKGAIIELDSLLKDNNIDVSAIHPKAIDAFKVGDKQFGLPTKFSNVVLFYNKDLFDQANIAYPDASWTWAEELEAAKAIRALGDDYFGVFRPIQTHEFYKTVAQNGGSMMNADQTAFTLNSPENIEALQMMIDRRNVSNVTPTDDQMGGMGDWDLFKSGRLGMLVTGIWAFGDFTENADFNWDIVVEPGIKQKATHFFSDAVVVSKASKNEAAAAKFAAYIASSPVVAQKRLDANWDLPVVLTDDVVKQYLSITPPDNKQAVFDSLEYLVMPPSLEKFNAIADDLMKYINEAIAGNMTVKDALDAAQEEISNKY